MEVKGKEAAGSYLFMYLVLKLPRQEFLSRWTTVLIDFSSRIFASCILQAKKQVFLKEHYFRSGFCRVSCVMTDKKINKYIKALSIAD